MILATILAVPILGLQVGQATETKLFTVQKNRILPGSIMLSPDLNHYSYTSGDHKVISDGKVVGTFASNGAVLYSGDSANWAFLGVEKAGDAPKLIWNGVEKKTDFPVVNIFRAGETGGICMVERKIEKVESPDGDKTKDKMVEHTRVVTPDETTDWCEHIEKIAFSDDGASYYMRISQSITQDKNAPPDPTAPTSQDFLVYKGGKKAPRDQIMQVFAAPKGEGFATLNSRNTVSFKRLSNVFRGEFYGKPVFSSDGKQFAFRNEFTGYSPAGNKPYYHYFINGMEITDLQIQTGLMFDDTGRKWVMCGLNDKTPYLYESTLGLVSYADANLGAAPAEPYKAARFVNGKMVLLFQAKRAKPLLFVEDKGLIELGSFAVFPDTLSVSPDGRKLVIAGTAGEETHAYVVDLETPGAGIDVLKGQYDLQNLAKGTFAWKNEKEVQFVVLRRSDLTRVVVRL